VALINNLEIGGRLADKALRAMAGYPKWTYDHNALVCEHDYQDFFFYVVPGWSWAASWVLIGSDDYYTYWSAVGTPYKFVQVYHYPFCNSSGLCQAGIPLIQEVTATMNQNGSPETRPYDGQKLLQYTGYPVFSTLDIQGNQWCVAVGFASELTVAAAAAACGLTGQGVDITITGFGA
jgi:hypothetical protein